MHVAYHEKRDTLDRDVDQEESQSADVVVDVKDGSCDVLDRDFLGLGGCVLNNQSFRRDTALPFRQKEALGRSRWHEYGCQKADNDREEAFEEENVSPFVDDHALDSPGRNTCEAANWSEYSGLAKGDCTLTQWQEVHRKHQPLMQPTHKCRHGTKVPHACRSR